MPPAQRPRPSHYRLDVTGLTCDDADGCDVPDEYSSARDLGQWQALGTRAWEHADPRFASTLSHANIVHTNAPPAPRRVRMLLITEKCDEVPCRTSWGSSAPWAAWRCRNRQRARGIFQGRKWMNRLNIHHSIVLGKARTLWSFRSTAKQVRVASSSPLARQSSVACIRLSSNRFSRSAHSGPSFRLVKERKYTHRNWTGG